MTTYVDAGAADSGGKDPAKCNYALSCVERRAHTAHGRASYCMPLLFASDNRAVGRKHCRHEQSRIPPLTTSTSSARTRTTRPTGTCRCLAPRSSPTRWPTARRRFSSSWGGRP